MRVSWVGVVLLALVLSGCGQEQEQGPAQGEPGRAQEAKQEQQEARKLSGTYSDEAGAVEYEFRGDKAYAKAFGPDVALDYTIEGDKLLIGPSGTQQVWTLKDDGSFEGPMGMRLRKKE